MIWTALLIGARGLRSSWASMARNWSLRWSASLRASSMRLRSSMSVTTAPAPSMVPSGVLTG